MEIRRILVPVDLNEPSFGAIGSAVGLAESVGAELTLLSVLSPVIVGDFGVLDPDPVGAMRRLKAQLGRWKQRNPHFPLRENSVRFVVKIGPTAQAIVDTARANRTDLIVMATHGRKGWARMMLGSVTESVIRRAKCPVMAVPPRVWQPAPAFGPLAAAAKG